MKCKQAAQLFSNRIEGGLRQDQSERLQAHLDHCPDCAELIGIMELNIRQLEGVPEPPMPEGLVRRLADIPRREIEAAGRPTTRSNMGANGHWLFSNAAAAVILAIFLTVNLTWFNPDFQNSIRWWRSLISHQSDKALQLASDWNARLNHLKQRVEYKIDTVRENGEPAEDGTGKSEETPSRLLMTEIIKALGLIGA